MESNQWVPFQEGEYLTVGAYLVSRAGSAVRIENGVIEVFKDNRGIRQVKGSGMIQPALLVEMHEETDDVDLILDLGGKYKYLLKKPAVHAGKLFTPGISALMLFSPSCPWEMMSIDDFESLMERIKIL